MSNQGNTTMLQLHLLTNVPTKYQLPTPYSSRDIAWTRYKKVKVTTARSMIKSRSHHDAAHMHAPTNVTTKYQLPTPYVCQNIAQIFKVKVTTARSNQGHNMMLHTYSPQPMSLPSINFLHLTVYKI